MTVPVSKGVLVKNGLLIAAPTLKDRWFSQAVVLLCQYDEDGALGLVVNRDGPVSIGDVVERLELPGTIDGPDPGPVGVLLGADDKVRLERLGKTWWGGPVETGAGFIVWRGRVEAEDGWNLGDEVAVSPSAECLNRLVSDGSRFHLCLGYTGWGPGQLDKEIQTGSWLFADLDAGILFDTPLTDRYEAALALLGLSRETLWMKPVDE
jgi:putative transcriptional regulator